MSSPKNSAVLTLNGVSRTVETGQPLSKLITGEMPCGGHGKCGKCKVIAHGCLSPLCESERNLLSTEELARGVRLACLTEVLGDCTVQTNVLAEKQSNQILTDGDMPSFLLAPAFSRYGMAIDIGTTTLAARLYASDGTLLGERSRLNPQSTWGADVVSRMEAAMRGEDEALADAICSALDALTQELADGAGFSAHEIDGVVLTGNTVMLHLLTKTSPEPLSHAPFAAERLFGETISAGELGMNSLAPETEIYLPPCMAAFVGADTVCALLATVLCHADESRLLVDIGTNGEMGLWHGGTLTVCSTAAGPAFEGVGISMGMRGADGAIDRVRIEGDRLGVHVIGKTDAVGICGSGLVDAVASLLDLEWLDETGYLEDDPIYLTDSVALTQEDIRMVQLAKSAICAGLRTLLLSQGIRAEEITATKIAGGFGHYLNMKHACRIGLLPAELAESIQTVGNAALTGAAMLLLGKDFRAECDALAKRAVVLELSTNPTFSEQYMMGMMLEENFDSN